MLRSMLCLLLVLQGLSSTLIKPESRVIIGMKTGVLLRMHVVAQDDTDEMQRIKLCVRDAVRAAYDQNCPDPAAPMQVNTLALLPMLTDIAVQTARSEGFEGNVSVTLETREFTEQSMGSYVLPAGEYPALMIRLGDAKGHNWWGLIDPALALESASIPCAEGGEIQWDWSLAALLQALFSKEACHA